MIYIASPYTHPDESVRRWRTAQARKYLHSLLDQGRAAFSPIVYGQAVTDGTCLPTNFEFWQQFNESFICKMSTAVHVLCLPDWKSSRGIAAEIAYARSIHLPVIYVAR